MATSNEMLDTLLGMDETRRAEILLLMAGSDSAKLEALSKDVEDSRKGREKAIAAKAKAAEVKARNEAIEALTVRVQSWDGSEEDSQEDLETLLDEVISLKGHITLDGFHDGFPTYTVVGLVAKKGGNKKGRPGKDTPTNFVDKDGNRILGAITDFARANVDAEVLEADYLKDVDENFDHDKKKVPFKKAGALLADQLVEDGYLVASEFVEDVSDNETEDVSEVVSEEVETVSAE